MNQSAHSWSLSTVLLIAGLFVSVAGVSYNLPQAQENFGVEGVPSETAGRFIAWLGAVLPGAALKLAEWWKSRGGDTSNITKLTSLIRLWLDLLGGDKVAKVIVVTVGGDSYEIPVQPITPLPVPQPTPQTIPNYDLVGGTV